MNVHMCGEINAYMLTLKIARCVQRLSFLHRVAVKMALEGAAAAFVSEPKAGWSVDAYYYYTSDEPYGAVNESESPACCYLASDCDGHSRGLQWWSKGDPTSYHGSWTKQEGVMALCFHCMGPVYVDTDSGDVRPRLLKTTYVHRRGEGIYEGQDQRRHKVRLVKYGSYTVQRCPTGGGLVWVDSASAASGSASAADPRKRARQGPA